MEEVQLGIVPGVQTKRIWKMQQKVSKMLFF